MTDQPIQRWRAYADFGGPVGIEPTPAGRFVTYADHVAALAAERGKVLTDAINAIKVAANVNRWHVGLPPSGTYEVAKFSDVLNTLMELE